MLIEISQNINGCRDRWMKKLAEGKRGEIPAQEYTPEKTVWRQWKETPAIRTNNAQQRTFELSPGCKPSWFARKLALTNASKEAIRTYDNNASLAEEYRQRLHTVGNYDDGRYWNEKDTPAPLTPVSGPRSDEEAPNILRRLGL